eukprot:m.26625 g.26625  ORF g.26625 m.26625 type:complete len:464 (+) comp9280_c1_seq2:75-1466(+)
MTSDIEKATFRSLIRSKAMFLSESAKRPSDDITESVKKSVKKQSEYGSVLHMEAPKTLQRKKKKKDMKDIGPKPAAKTTSKKDTDAGDKSLALVLQNTASNSSKTTTSTALAINSNGKKPMTKELAMASKAPTMPKPQWHPQWKLFRSISGHTGWVRCLAVEPKNQWFVSGSADRTIKIWDLATCTLKLTLTGHISALRGLEVSPRHPYLFSAGEDKMVCCWDLEQNKIIRKYHGHLSAVYALKLHPTLDIVFTGGRDGTVRVWDMRTAKQVHCLSGHTSTVASLESFEVDPQVISGSHDSTIRLWDIRKAKAMSILTNHKKSVRALCKHPQESTFVSGAADNIKQWYLPHGKFIQNLSGHNAIINSLAVSPSGVMASGSDNGVINFWDYRTGYRFQHLDAIAQPGSLDCESGVYDMVFDKSYSRLLTAEADKTIKIYKEDNDTTEETHPVVWKPNVVRRSRF